MNVLLEDKHSFGCKVEAKTLVALQKESEVRAAIQAWSTESYLILGGGTNLLFLQPTVERVLAVRIPGMEVLTEDKSSVEIEVGAGVGWHALVMATLERGWFGLENLALIPGLTGASPMQNIGAYGVELKDFCIGVQVWDRKTAQSSYLKGSELAFGYRSSLFKTEAKHRYLISSVRLKLRKQGFHKPETAYGSIRQELESRGIDPEKASPKEVAEVVMAIRKSKLPDPKELGNAGSFFKNPEVEAEVALDLEAKYPEIPRYKQANGKVKLAAGWLIEQAGWKGKREGLVGMHKNQALVLVNYGGASGQELHHFASKVAQDVFFKFGIALEAEVNCWPDG